MTVPGPFLRIIVGPPLGQGGATTSRRVPMHTLRGALRLAGLASLSALFIGCGGCGSKLDGTYTNPSGIVMLELRSGGKATMGLGGETRECTHAEEGKQVKLTCGGEKITLRVNDDGTLFAPGFIGVMKKSK
jgi:hypothetical protein